MGNAVRSRTADAARGESASTKHGRRARQPPTAPGSDARSSSRASLRTATPSSVPSRASRRGSITAGTGGNALMHAALALRTLAAEAHVAGHWQTGAPPPTPAPVR
jgi:hypothetical protein